MTDKTFKLIHAVVDARLSNDGWGVVENDNSKPYSVSLRVSSLTESLFGYSETAKCIGKSLIPLHLPL